MASKLDRILEVLEVHLSAKFHQAECSGSRVIMYTNFSVPSRNGEESDNQVL